jgi:hypothetical protein
VIAVEDAVEDQVDEMVKDQVAASLKIHMPQELQDELAGYKRQLEQLRWSLHNSSVLQ